MKRVLVIIFLLSGTGCVLAQKQSVGLRIGNPLGITYKRYLPNDRAFEFGLGTAPSGWSSNYYKNSFKDYNHYDNYDYRSHDVNSTIYFQGRYLFQYNIPIEGMVGKLDWYWGVGALLKIANVNFTYQDGDSPSNIGHDTKTDIDFGPEGIAGMEYTFDDVPITIFGEVSVMLEFADRPLTFRCFGAAGARFNF
jgi:hypothetical protein